MDAKAGNCEGDNNTESGKRLDLTNEMESEAQPFIMMRLHSTLLVDCLTTTLPNVPVLKLNVSVHKDFSLYFATFVL